MKKLKALLTMLRAMLQSDKISVTCVKRVGIGVKVETHFWNMGDMEFLMLIATRWMSAEHKEEYDAEQRIIKQANELIKN